MKFYRKREDCRVYSHKKSQQTSGSIVPVGPVIIMMPGLTTRFFFFEDLRMIETERGPVTDASAN